MFVLAGAVGFAYHATALSAGGQVQYGVIWVLLLRCVAIAAGVFLLSGAAWARWLALAWIAYHVVVSALHSLSEALVHIAIFAVVVYVLFRPPAVAYYRVRRRKQAE
ncbi:MAG: hypothetical protein ACRD8O_06755 [Bryobacteraceae bacterium]